MALVTLWENLLTHTVQERMTESCVIFLLNKVIPFRLCICVNREGFERLGHLFLVASCVTLSNPSYVYLCVNTVHVCAHVCIYKSTKNKQFFKIHFEANVHSKIV